MTQRFSEDWDSLSHKLGYANRRAMLEDLYCVQKLSLSQIGERLSCSGHCVGKNLACEGIERRQRGGFNNDYSQTKKLFRLDQRIILGTDFNLIARAAYVSTTLLYKYRKNMKRRIK